MSQTFGELLWPITWLWAYASRGPLSEALLLAIHAFVVWLIFIKFKALVQFRAGSTDPRAVEQRQLALYGARTTQLRVRSEQLAQRVNLHLALGGSFDDAPAVPVAARAASSPTP